MCFSIPHCEESCVHSVWKIVFASCCSETWGKLQGFSLSLLASHQAYIPYTHSSFVIRDTMLSYAARLVL